MATNVQQAMLLSLLMRGVSSATLYRKDTAMIRSLLIMSDDIFLSRIARPVFEDSGFTVSAFEQSTEGIAACFADLPDLLIIKYSSTGSPPDAFRVVHTLRRDTRTKHLPVLMIAAVEGEARAVGVTDWVDVVFDIDTLVQRAVSLLHV